MIIKMIVVYETTIYENYKMKEMRRYRGLGIRIQDRLTHSDLNRLDKWFWDRHHYILTYKSTIQLTEVRSIRDRDVEEEYHSWDQPEEIPEEIRSDLEYLGDRVKRWGYFIHDVYL